MAEDNPMVDWNLQLSEENVLDDFINAFSYPDTITYQGEHYNLTKAYDTFWSQFMNNPVCSDKLRKLPKTSLRNEKLKSLARIIKRGWQDERYLPTQFSEPFLRSCIFGKESLMEISAGMILDFIEDDKEVKVIKKLLKYGKHQLDNKGLTVLTKYSPEAPISISNLNEEACTIVVQKILDELDTIIWEWNKELKDLLELKDFNFIMRQRKACMSRDNSNSDYDDLDSFENDLPHVLWTTFFQGWCDGHIDFYFNMLRRNDWACYGCGKIGSKHLMGNDGSNCGASVNTLRHDSVLNKIEKKLQEASSKEGSFFSSAEDWTFLKRLHSENKCYTWPEELGMQDEILQPPHLLVYSLTPQKKVMIVEVSVMWEEWYKLSPDKRQFKTKTEEYEGIVKKLKSNGFDVDFKDIEMGCRGVLCKDLYNMFSQDLKMEHGEISKTLEEVSKEIVEYAYAKYIHSKNKKKASSTGVKRKFED